MALACIFSFLCDAYTWRRRAMWANAWNIYMHITPVFAEIVPLFMRNISRTQEKTKKMPMKSICRFCELSRLWVEWNCCCFYVILSICWVFESKFHAAKVFDNSSIGPSKIKSVPKLATKFIILVSSKRCITQAMEWETRMNRMMAAFSSSRVVGKQLVASNIGVSLYSGRFAQMRKFWIHAYR